jgi:polysaccharide deacetylase 2 family uncharacterized protein YibQ
MAKNDPGKAAILVGMSDYEMKARLEKNLETVPHAGGISNHMGSRFTSDEKAVRSLFSILQKIENGSLFFFDSRTTTHLVSPALAKKTKIKTFANDLFLDHEDDLKAMLKQLDILKSKAKKEGTAAAIGHIQRKNMVPALSKVIPQFRREGIEFVYLSDLIE